MRINDQASHRNQGFEAVDRLVEPLLPVVVVLVHTIPWNMSQTVSGNLWPPSQRRTAASRH